MGDDVYGPVFAGGIGLMFVGVISAFIVGNLIPDDAWEFLANEGFEEEERIMMEKREIRDREEREEVDRVAGNSEGSMFDDYS